MIGQIINYRYEILEKIGDGKLFSVYKSRDKVLNRLVAVKVLSAELSANEAFRNAVRDGYLAATDLSHPNLARILEAESSEEASFVACEYVRGTNVKERVHRGGPISVPLALDIIIPVLEALEYAHANRAVHGDLRPQDIIVSPDGEIKLTDFGLATALRQCPDVTDRFALRSACYQAPEVAEGEPASPSSDIYSVGVVLYEMLTGALPYDATTAVAVALKQAREAAPTPRTVNTGVPKSLSDLVMRAIERSPEDRYPSASAMLADLRAIRDALRLGRPLSIPQPPVSGRSARTSAKAPPPAAPEHSMRKSYLWLILVFMVVFLASLGATLFFQGERARSNVPPMMGKTWDEAHYVAQQAGLRIREEGRIYNDNYKEGQICAVNPPTGASLERGSLVKVRISKGPARQPVPDLIGLPETEAYRVVSEERFAIGKITPEYNDTIPMNSVISQSPAPGAMRVPSSAITLVISLGAKPDTDTRFETPPTAQERKFNVDVEVPADAETSQEVRIVVDDDRGEQIVYQRYHEPGDTLREPISVYGEYARIKIYVGGEKISDKPY